MSPALAGGFLTTDHEESPVSSFLKSYCSLVYLHMSHSFYRGGAWGDKQFIRERVEFGVVDADPTLDEEVEGGKTL